MTEPLESYINDGVGFHVFKGTVWRVSGDHDGDPIWDDVDRDYVVAAKVLWDSLTEEDLPKATMPNAIFPVIFEHKYLSYRSALPDSLTYKIVQYAAINYLAGKRYD